MVDRIAAKEFRPNLYLSQDFIDEEKSPPLLAAGKDSYLDPCEEEKPERKPERKPPPQIPVTGFRFGNNDKGKTVLQGFYPQEVPPAYGTLWKTSLFEKVFEKKSPEPAKDKDYSDLLREAYHFLNDGEIQKARRIAKSVLSESPKEPEALFIVAVCNVFEGKFEAAEKRLNALYAASPRNDVYYFGKGFYHFMRKEFEQAAFWLEKLSKGEPDDFEYLKVLFFAYQLSGQTEKALEVLSRSKPRTTEEKATLTLAKFMLGDTKKVIEELDAILLESQNNADILGSYGWVLTAMGNYEKSEELAMKALAINPDQPQALGVMAAKSWNEGVFNSEAERKIPLLQKLHDILSGQKRAFVERQSFVTFRQTSSLGVIIGVSLQESKVMLGAALLANNQNQEAYTILKEALEQEDWHSQYFSQNFALRLLAESERMLEKIGDAKEHFKASFDREPENPFMLAGYLDVLLMTGDAAEAEKYIPLAEKIRGKGASAFLELSIGSHYLQPNTVDKALPYLQRALTLDPQNPTLHQRIALAYLMKAKWEKAEGAAQAMLRLEGPKERAHQILVEASLGKEKWGEAETRGAEGFADVENKGDWASWMARQYLMAFESKILEDGIFSETLETCPFLKNAEKWLGIQHQETGTFEPLGEPNWRFIRLINGTLTAQEMESLKGEKQPYAKMLAAFTEGNNEGAKKHLHEMEKAPVSGLADGFINYYPYFKTGDMAFIGGIFETLWTQPDNRPALIQLAENMVFKPFPKKSRGLVASVAVRVGDDYYHHNDIEEAMKWYQKAVKANPSEKAGQIGLDNCSKLLKNRPLGNEK